MEIEVDIYSGVQLVSYVLQGNKKPLPLNGKEVTLFWSGGVDSTFMLVYLLVHGYKVHTVHCELTNNGSKNKREDWAREKIRNWILENTRLGDNWNHLPNPLSIVKVPAGGFRACLAQAPLWLVNTQFEGRNLYGVPPVYVIAYVNGDDAIHWIPAFNKIVEGYRMLSKPDEPKIEVLFPLASIKKSWYYRSLRPLWGKMTWCERDVLKVNCDCPPCSRHRHELKPIEDSCL